MGTRVVNCVKLGKEAPGLDAPPFEGELGQEIYEKVSAEAWAKWSDEVMIQVINEYRLNLADPEHYNTLLEQMKGFLNMESDEKTLDIGDAKRGS